MNPLCIDLYCGLGGWFAGFLAEGYRCIGFDIERHDYGSGGYPGQLVLQDVLTLHGSQFRGAACIVASPPCTEYSWMAMPWKRGKRAAAALRGKAEFPAGYHGSRTIADLNALFDACFRIQREASKAAGRHIPMVVENVRGAQPWVGKAQANYGSFYLWGDIAMVGGRIVAPQPRFGGDYARAFPAQKFNPDGTGHPQGSWFAIADSKVRGSKNNGGSWFNIGSPGQTETNCNPVHDALKVPGLNFHDHEKGLPGRSFQSAAVASLTRGALVEGFKGVDGKSWIRDKAKDPRPNHSNTTARKAASAMIARIPFELSRWVARCYKPTERAELRLTV